MDDLNKLQILRNEIDTIDTELLKLFEERMEKAQEIADFKAEHSMEILDASREKIVLQKTDLMKNPALKRYAVDLFQTLMEMSKDYQEERMRLGDSRTSDSEPAKVIPESDQRAGNQSKESLKEVRAGVVGFQGLPGSYSEGALRQHFGESVPSRNYAGFEDVFQALQAQEIDYGVLPLENSFTGGIAEVYDLLCKYGFYIVGEECVQVDHNLLAPKGAEIGSIKEIYSHPQAFLQCNQFLKRYPDWNPISYSNTAVSAKYVADSGCPEKAAIASRRAAELYGLSVLASGINNKEDNFTRFIIIGKNPEQRPENNKISIAVAIAHEPGSLYRILSHFAKNGLNMMKIESRPITDRTWEYLFYIDFEGNLEKAEVQKAVDDIQQESTFYRLLGNYCSDR